MNREMTTGIILIALGIIIMAILGGIGNKMIQEARTEMAQQNKDEIIDHQDTIKKDIIDNSNSNKSEIIEKTNELKEGQKDIKSEIQNSSKQPNIVIKDSPNSNVQIAEQGNNTVNQNKSINVKNSPGSINTIDHKGDINVTQKTYKTEIKADQVSINQDQNPRKLTKEREQSILSKIKQEMQKFEHDKNTRINVQYPMMASDGQSYGKQVGEFLLRKGFTNINLQSAIASGEDEVKFNYSSNKSGVWVILPIRGK